MVVGEASLNLGSLHYAPTSNENSLSWRSRLILLCLTRNVLKGTFKGKQWRKRMWVNGKCGDRDAEQPSIRKERTDMPEDRWLVVKDIECRVICDSCMKC